MSESRSAERGAASIVMGREEVAPASIAAELDKIRREAAALDSAQEENGKPAAPRVRSTLSNLVMLLSPTHSTAAGDTIEELITDLCVSHPSRFFIIEYHDEPSQPASRLRTAVSSRCVLASSGVHVCSEEVYISADPLTAPRVQNLLFSLLVPDIDVVLLVLNDPCIGKGGARGEEQAGAMNPGMQALYGDLNALSDRVVFDSALFGSYERSAASLFLADQEDARGDTVYRDLCWSRLQRWRNYVAEQFDAAHAQDALETLETIRISVTAAKDRLLAMAPSDALLMAGWFCTCLSLELEEQCNQIPSGMRLSTRTATGRSVALEFLASEEAGDGSGELRSIELLLSGNTRIVLARKPGEPTIELSGAFAAKAADAPSCEVFVRRVPYLVENFRKSVISNIRFNETDEAYRSAELAAREIGAILLKGC